MDIEFLKRVTVRFRKTFSATIGVVGSIVTISLALSSLKIWFLAAFALLLSIALSFNCFLYIEKSKNARKLGERAKKLLKVFDKTHNTWHIYKRLNDNLHEGVELDEFIKKIHHSIANLINNFRQSMILLHPGEDFRLSMKSISYKDLKNLDIADGESYKQTPFVLKLKCHGN
jgi:hypothetical protein